MDPIEREVITATAIKAGMHPARVEAMLTKAEGASKAKRRGRGWPRTWDTAEIIPTELR